MSAGPAAAGSGRPFGGERGAALVVVLLFAALLSELTVAVLRGSASGARAASVFLDGARADELGRGAADALAAHILAGGAAAGRGGAFALRLAGAEVEVDYRSESARVDLNKGPPALIAAVIGAAGADEGAVGGVLDRLAGLRRPPGPARPAAPAPAPGGATAPAAALFPPPARPAQLVEDVGEEVSRWRLPADVAARAAGALTVANGTAEVDPVLAGDLVLKALLGDDARVADYKERRRQGFTDTDAALALLPVPARAYAGFADVSAVHASVRVTVGRRLTRRYDIIMDPPAFPGQAPDILSWRPVT